MELFDFQEVSRDWLLHRTRAGNFDEMGVGKTAPTIMAAAETGRQTLVTAPGYLLPNWAKEIAQWVPNAKVLVANGERPKRQLMFDNRDADFILTPYHSWHSYPSLLKDKRANFVYDEAHRLRGRNSAWTKKIYQLQNSDNKNKDSRFWFLTGTPLVRDAGDLYPFLHMMDRDIFRSYWTFVEKHCHLTRDPWTTIVGDVLNPEAFRELMDMYAIRRLQQDIPMLAGLETIDRDIWVDLPPSVLVTLKRLKQEFILSHPDLEEEEFFEFSGEIFAKMRMMTSNPPTQDNPKMKAFGEFLEDMPERGVVFTWFRDTAAIAAEVCKKLCRPHAVITGDVRSNLRVKYVEQYDAKDGFILIGTIAAMKEGLNLQAGRNVCFLEESELPADNEQAIGRCKRMGQKRPVMVTRIMANKTLDQVTHKNVGKRDKSIRQAMLEFLHDQ